MSSGYERYINKVVSFYRTVCHSLYYIHTREKYVQSDHELTMFHCEMRFHQAAHCTKHDRNMFIPSSWFLDVSQTKHVSAGVVSWLNTALPFVFKRT